VSSSILFLRCQRSTVNRILSGLIASSLLSLQVQATYPGFPWYFFSIVYQGIGLISQFDFLPSFYLLRMLSASLPYYQFIFVKATEAVIVIFVPLSPYLLPNINNTIGINVTGDLNLGIPRGLEVSQPDEISQRPIVTSHLPFTLRTWISTLV
jgi:hypothetical protein